MKRKLHGCRSRNQLRGSNGCTVAPDLANPFALSQIIRDAYESGSNATYLIPVIEIPLMNCFWQKKNTTRTGRITMLVAAISRFHCVPPALL